ncbi:hypothetical protein UlMin_032160 [Ulmus minor]
MCTISQLVEYYYITYHVSDFNVQVSRYFGHVLDVLCSLSLDVVKPPDLAFEDIPVEISNDSRYMPYFKNLYHFFLQDCIGAIDRVHVSASISLEKQIPFIGRKGSPTQNVMVVCNFDMQFIFAYAGCEGKHYLVDAGYPQPKGFLGPYKGERYHIQEFRQSGQPSGHREVFNHEHSSLRSVIERTFGMWKKKWKILRDMPSYPFTTQINIVIATMTLQNYIRRKTERDRHFDKINDNQLDIIPEETSEARDEFPTMNALRSP